jgi:hypothetical protein
MKTPGMRIKKPKQRGEWAELRFMARAAENGLNVSKPWGDSGRYDVVVDHNGQLLRIQVKSTMFKSHGSWVCNSRPDVTKRYKRREFDFLAAYIIPEDIWYIFPSLVVSKRINLWLAPHKKDHRYECYREAWKLLKEKKS